MSDPEISDFRHEVAQRNVEAILDATARLLERGASANFSAVAAESGLSRPTVYAHFKNRRRLLEALVERTVGQTTAALASAHPDDGAPADALRRLITASWEHLHRHESLARAAASELSPEAMRHAHHDARNLIGQLIERGRSEGAFRTDLPTDWLVTVSLAMTHAAAEGVRSGELDPDTASEVLADLIADLILGSRP
jgi:AcrR family transcriptional regulator